MQWKVVIEITSPAGKYRSFMKWFSSIDERREYLIGLKNKYPLYKIVITITLGNNMHYSCRARYFYPTSVTLKAESEKNGYDFKKAIVALYKKSTATRLIYKHYLK